MNDPDQLRDALLDCEAAELRTHVTLPVGALADIRGKLRAGQAIKLELQRREAPADITEPPVRKAFAIAFAALEQAAAGFAAREEALAHAPPVPADIEAARIEQAAEALRKAVRAARRAGVRFKLPRLKRKPAT